jgi:hypothetical protein
MALRKCPIHNVPLKYEGQPGNFGFDQSCPICKKKLDCWEWIAIKKDLESKKVKRPKKEILRMEGQKTCGTCIVCGMKLLLNDSAHCKLRDLQVYKVSIACDQYLKHVPPFQNCSNCRSSMKAPEAGTWITPYGCRKRVCFPSENQYTTYISCEKFDSKQTVLKEALAYYKRKSEILERLRDGTV